MRGRKYCYQARNLAIGVAPAIVAGRSMLPSDASAQTSGPAASELPPITVIAPTPLAGTHTLKPQKPKVTETATRGRTNRGTGSSTATAAPVAGSEPSPAVSSNSSYIDRDKVPSNTEVITSKEFSHDY